MSMPHLQTLDAKKKQSSLFHRAVGDEVKKCLFALPTERGEKRLRRFSPSFDVSPLVNRDQLFQNIFDALAQ
jgi:hypothetical protein